jgi:hypothetical protein
VVYTSVGLGYAELRSALRETYRNRRRCNWHRRIHRGLLEACVHFARNGFRIVDAMVIARLRVALRELGITNRRLSILLDGDAKAAEMQFRYKECGVFRWLPKLEQWLKSEAYRFWLGTIQHSLENGVCQIMEAGPCCTKGK